MPLPSASTTRALPGRVGRDLRGLSLQDERVVMACFFGLGGLSLALVGLVPAWPYVDTLRVWVAAVPAGLASLGLLAVRSVRPVAYQVLLCLGDVVIGLAVHAGNGGAASSCFALYSSWVVIWSILFLPRRAALLHSALACGVVVVELLGVEPAGQAALHATLLTVLTGSTGLVVGGLIRHAGDLSTRDGLTGLLNEEGLARVVARHLAASQGAAPGLLVLIDLDRFSELNQALGRPGGDEVLRQVAGATSEGSGPFGGRVARLGGDDFALWLPSVPEAGGGGRAAHEAVQMIAEHLRGAARGPFVVEGIAVEIDVTVGAALVPAHGRDLTTLLQRADTALHAARRDDRADVLWSPELDRATASELALQSELRAAVSAGQLRLHYQPLVAAGTGHVAGVEALVRWQHPTRGLLAPSAFLPAAEHGSVIVALTDWVLDEALRQAALWQAAGHPLRVSVNLSARLVADEGLVDNVRNRLRRAGVPPSLLMLEVTESAVTAQPKRAAGVLAELRALGVQIALDDFGTGYTSFAMLQDLPIDELKVDQRFVSGALTRTGDRAIVHALVDLGHRLGFEVVAEGVEDDATRELLTDQGYDLLQGYLFSRPVVAEEIDALRRSSMTELRG